MWLNLGTTMTWARHSGKSTPGEATFRFYVVGRVQAVGADEAARPHSQPGARPQVPLPGQLDPKKEKAPLFWLLARCMGLLVWPM